MRHVKINSAVSIHAALAELILFLGFKFSCTIVLKKGNKGDRTAITESSVSKVVSGALLMAGRLHFLEHIVYEYGCFSGSGRVKGLLLLAYEHDALNN